MRVGTFADTLDVRHYARVQFRIWSEVDTVIILFDSKAEGDRFLDDLAKSNGIRINGCLIPYHSIIHVSTSGVCDPGESIVKLV